MSSAITDTIVEVKDLKMYFPVTHGILKHKVADVKALDGISFKIKYGETMGLVGESGSGKTTVGRCILRLYKPTQGRIIFEGKDISNLPERKLRPLRRKMSLIFQDPYGSLDPRKNAGSIVADPLLVHHLVHSRAEYRDNIDRLFDIVGLDPNMADRFPHEFSGGQRQRIGIARALACEPSFIVCDEAVSALDVSVQAQIINLLEELKLKLNRISFLFIAHDLAVVQHISDRIGVMYLGRIVEITTWKELYDNPLHPYTQALLSAVPVADPFLEEKRSRIILEGEVPSPMYPPTGCAFHPRCFMAMPDCEHTIPVLRNVASDHEVACMRV